jgi:hypothetical protein
MPDLPPHAAITELLRAFEAGELSKGDKNALGWAISRSTRFNPNPEIHRTGVQADAFLKKLREFLAAQH